MKKILAVIFALLMTISLAGCTEYNNPNESGGDESGTITTPTEPTTPTPTPTEEGVFSVTLYYNNLKYIPSETIYALWNDGQSINSAQFVSGVAKISGLDGDYNVTLSALPTGYTYEPNIYSATNDDKDIIITLYRITPTSGAGTGKYDESILLTGTGAYRATLYSSSQTVFFKYTPTYAGTYSMTSLLSVTANEINPILDVYWGNSQWVPDDPTEIIDDGGSANTYTKNFRWEVYRASDEQPTYTFAIHAECINESAFPVNIDFLLVREGDYTRDDGSYEIIYPTFNITEVEQPSGTFKYAYNIDSNNPKTFQSSYFKLNPDDGFYHVYDLTKYASTNGYGPVLYAKLTKDCEVMQTRDASGKIVENNGFLNLLVSLKVNGKNYNPFFFEINADGSIKYQNRLNSQGIDTGNSINFPSGYTDTYRDSFGQPVTSGTIYKYINSDGAYPVTAELKQFLQDFAVGNRFFMDGFGSLESSGYNSDEDSQWLFACGYYE
jgi:hypothetical protein